MPDPNLADMSKRSRSSLRPDQHWIITVDAPRLQKARAERVLSLRRLAAESGVSTRTLARLETGQAKTCHRATLYRIAAALADEPLLMFWELAAADDVPALKRQLPLTSHPAASSWICSRTFAAQPDQVAEARAFLGRILHGCPMAYDATVICSELFTNAIQHSRSALPGGKVTLRAEVCEQEYAWLEVEDQGGDWTEGNRDGESGRGLEIVAALADYWDIKTRDPRRFFCVRLDWPGRQHQGGS